MDVKSTFNNVEKTFLGKRMDELGVGADLIRWTISFMTDQKVKLALDGEVREPNVVDTGVLRALQPHPSCSSHIFPESLTRWKGLPQGSEGYPLWTT